MKFSAIILGAFAALAIAAPAAPADVSDVAALEARAVGDVEATNELVARQIWSCTCTNGRRVCCGAGGACSFSKC